MNAVRIQVNVGNDFLSVQPDGETPLWEQADRRQVVIIQDCYRRITLWEGRHER